ncbi:MAG: hypothetical protein ACXAEF_07710 [Candidatus Thorarchaeota archaeon]|jgi:hypothetical protein
MSVSWPTICCGCGTSSDLNQYEYRWEKESGRCGAGPRTVTTRSLGVHAALCPHCLNESKKSTSKGWIVSVLVFFILTATAYAISSINAFAPLVAYPSFIILSAIPFLFVAAYSGLRARPFLYFIGIKPSFRGARLILKSQNYAAAFMMVNQSTEVEHRPNFTGHKDILDEGTFMVACCIFGIIVPWLIPIIIGMLGM